MGLDEYEIVTKLEENCKKHENQLTKANECTGIANIIANMHHEGKGIHDLKKYKYEH